jgi:hypothetical protein
VNTKVREELMKQKKVFSMLGFNYIDFKDKRIINYVANSLKKVNTGAYVCFGSVNYNEAITYSLDNLKVFGEEPFVKVSKMISVVPFMKVMQNRNGYSCFVSYNLDDDTMKVDKNSGTVVHYKVPENPDIMASFHIGHEHIHALKETNYDEYVDGQVFGDVIPMLYEFIMADSFPEMKKEIYKFRLSFLKEDYKHYESAISQMKKSKTDKDLYKIIATRSGQYLNSYYYATILFNMYKKNLDLILELVNKVLNHEMTTRVMLEKLGLLHCEDNIIYDSEFDEVIKSVKKV